MKTKSEKANTETILDELRGIAKSDNEIYFEDNKEERLSRQ